jgi:hypothetical protein
MGRLTAWIVRNVDGLVALLLAALIAVLAWVDVAGANEVNGATLLVLAVLAATLLRDRSRAELLEHDLRTAVRQTGPVLAGLPERLDRVAELGDVVAAARRALDEMSMVRVLSGREIGHALAEARRDTDRWIFKGGTGTYLRAVTLPECVENARRENRTLLMRLEIVDPTNADLCDRYARFQRSLATRPDGVGETWTLDRARKEAFATILAACWYRQRFGLLDIDIGLSSTMTTFRWDMSAHSVIMTQENPSAPALMIERGKYYYDRYSLELLTSLEQARRVPIEQAKAVPLSDEPTVEEARRLFDVLDLPLPTSFIDRDVADVIRKAIQPRNPYQ